MTETAECSKQQLSYARQGDYWNARVPGLCVTSSGVVLAYGEARKGRGVDWDAIDVQMRRSFDGGRTWDPARCLVSHQDFGSGPSHNFTAVRDNRTGRMHALVRHGYQRLFTTCSIRPD